ncbi:MAG: DUF2791 family P-loop domain-containing protein [Deltaproteobacteria bacterium]|nr:DUF2791 family P-loop domain-containing protein [Deltaproteobacteria bacterium]
MNYKFNKGSGVRHKKYGHGVVLSTRFNGYEFLVSFGRFRVWIRGDELLEDRGGVHLAYSKGEAAHLSEFEKFLTGLAGREFEGRQAPGARRKERITEEPSSISKAARVEEIAAIEAFRLGIVPYGQVKNWTVGRDEEAQRVKDWLKSESEGAILIEGAYGSGKSHLLYYLYDTALSEGYAVSLASFDPTEGSGAFPKRVYRKIVQNLKVPLKNNRVSFREMVVELSEINRNILHSHKLIGRFLDSLGKQDIDEVSWDWFEGREGVKGDMGSMFDFTTVANIYCNLLSAFSAAMAEHLNLKGLLILLDETETAKSAYYHYYFSRGMNFFKGLSLAANDDHMLLEERVSKRDNVYRGEDTGLIYSGHMRIPYLFKIPSFLKVVFAITPGVLTDEFRKFRETLDVIALDNVKIHDLRVIFGRFAEHYSRVYGVGIPPAHRERYFRLLLDTIKYSSTRNFIKSMVELFDYMRFYPESSAEAMLLRA